MNGSRPNVLAVFVYVCVCVCLSVDNESTCIIWLAQFDVIRSNKGANRDWMKEGRRIYNKPNKQAILFARRRCEILKRTRHTNCIEPQWCCQHTRRRHNVLTRGFLAVLAVHVTLRHPDNCPNHWSMRQRAQWAADWWAKQCKQTALWPHCPTGVARVGQCQKSRESVGRHWGAGARTALHTPTNWLIVFHFTGFASQTMATGNWPFSSRRGKEKGKRLYLCQ